MLKDYYIVYCSVSSIQGITEYIRITFSPQLKIENCTEKMKSSKQAHSLLEVRAVVAYSTKRSGYSSA